MRNAVVIVAAGKGIRAGGDVAKQWQQIAGKTSVDWCVQAFQAHPDIDDIVLVLHPGDMDKTGRFANLTLIAGGADRAASVMAGLNKLSENPPDNVLIHDVARPCISQLIISKVLGALETHPGAAPALALTDTLWSGDKAQVSGSKDREGLYRAQTPQGFRFAEIFAAHQSFKGQATDDVSVAQAAGIKVAIVEGDEDNLKITHPGDFARAERILHEKNRGHMDIRTGNGFDVHAFEAGDHVVLCGVKIPHNKSLKGHSDADVAMHAITDAIYGALAMGDIGQWFSPSQAKWKDAASDIFLRHAVGLAIEHGFTITHSDCTIICEDPKIGPHSLAMRQRLAEIMELELSRVSIKATTSEQLGFTGRGEGIAANATVTLVKA